MEIVTLFKALPAAKRAEVTDFARFLLEGSTGSCELNASDLHAASRHTSMPKRKPPAAKVYPENSQVALTYL